MNVNFTCKSLLILNHCSSIYSQTAIFKYSTSTCTIVHPCHTLSFYIFAFLPKAGLNFLPSNDLVHELFFAEPFIFGNRLRGLTSPANLHNQDFGFHASIGPSIRDDRGSWRDSWRSSRHLLLDNESRRLSDERNSRGFRGSDRSRRKMRAQRDDDDPEWVSNSFDVLTSLKVSLVNLTLHKSDANNMNQEVCDVTQRR